MYEIILVGFLWLAVGAFSMVVWSGSVEGFHGTPARVAAIMSMISLPLGPISLMLWFLAAIGLGVGVTLFESFKTAKAAFRDK